MDEPALNRVLSRLGIHVEGKNVQRHTGKIWLNFKCPLAPFSHSHNYTPDRNPSAGAVTDKKGHASRWHCLGCKSHGTIFELAHRLSGLHPGSDIPYMAIADEIMEVESTGLEQLQWGQDVGGLEPLPEPLIEEAYEGLWPDVSGTPAEGYLESRGISAATALSLSLLFDAHRNRVLFPVRSRAGELFGFSGRAITPHAKPRILDYEGLPKRHLILGANRWNAGRPLILVEGLFGFAHLVEIGTEALANVGALLGSVMTPEKATIIKDFGAPTYLLMDPDEAGDACLFGPVDDQGIEHPERGAIHMLQADAIPLFVPEYPEGVTDVDNFTLDDVRAILAAPPYGFSGLPPLR